MRLRSLVAGLLGGVLLAGCAAPGASTEPLPMVSAEPALVAKREAAGIADCPATPATAEPVAGGLPDVVLGCLGSGQQVNLAALRGKPMVINFWAQWCAPCRAEAPHLVKLHDEFGDRVAFYGVNLRDDKGTAEAFERNFGVDYPSVEDRTGEVLMAMSDYVPAQAVPTTLVLDAKGRVAARVLGQIDESTVRTLIQDQLGGASAAPSASATA